MPELISCPGCGRRLKVPDGLDGQMVQCPSCQAQFRAGPSLDELPEVVPVEADAAAPNPFAWPEPSAGARRAQPPRRSAIRSILGLVAGLTVAVLAVLSSLSGVMVLESLRPPAGPVLVREDPKQRRQEVMAAFQDGQPVDPNEVAGELQPLFDGLGAALRAADANRISAHFNVDRMLDELVADVEQLRQAILAITAQEDPDAAERHLQRIADASFPATIEAVRWLVSGMVRVHRGQFEQALGDLDRARRLRPDLPVVDLLYGVIHNRLGNWEVALQHLTAYRDLLGDDATVCFECGEALRGVGRFPEAQASYRRCLDEDPKHLDAFLGLLGALAPGEPRDDLGERFARLDSPIESFRACVDDCLERRDAESLDRLAQAMRTIDPNHGPADFYRALALAWTNQAEQALPLVRLGLAKEKDPDQRRRCLEHVLPALAQAGWAQEAYAAAPDPVEAFRLLAGQLRFQSRELSWLVAGHAVQRPNDPLLPFYEGEVHVQEERFAEAEAAFARGMENPPDQAQLESFRPSRVLARYRTKQGWSAYQEIGPPWETFAQLAYLCLADGDLALLEALVEAHAKREPTSADLRRVRIALKLRQNQPAEAIALFRAALEKALDDDQRREITDNFLLAALDAEQPLQGYQAASDPHYAFRLLASELEERESTAELRRLIDLHRQRDPNDPWLHYHLGQLQANDQKWEQAAADFAAACRQASAEDRAIFRWSRVYTMYRSGRGLEAYRDETPALRQETFVQLADLFVQDRDVAGLAALVDAHRPSGGDPAELLFQQARLKCLAGQVADAQPLWSQAWQKQTRDYRRRAYVIDLVALLAEAGHLLEGYRAAPDQALAFETLAGRLVHQKKADDLQRLLAEHEKRAGAGPLWHYFNGECQLLRGQVEQAEAHLLSALARCHSHDRWRVRNALFRARLRAGRIAETYRDFGANARLFDLLAGLCLVEKNAPQLQALLRDHRRYWPDDPDLPAWQVDLLWLQEDYAAMLARLEEQRTFFSLPRHRWKLADYRVRGLVRLKRLADAVREAEALDQKNWGNPLLLVLAHAAAGDEKQAISALQKHGRSRYLVEDCYQDADLGPLLAGPRFEEFRRRFHRPPAEP